MPLKKKGKTQKKVHINLRKNKVRQIYCSSLNETNVEEKTEEKLKRKKGGTNSGNYKNSNSGSKIVFDEFPDITMDELMKMA